MRPLPALTPLVRETAAPAAEVQGHEAALVAAFAAVDEPLSGAVNALGTLHTHLKLMGDGRAAVPTPALGDAPVARKRAAFDVVGAGRHRDGADAREAEPTSTRIGSSGSPNA